MLSRLRLSVLGFACLWGTALCDELRILPDKVVLDRPEAAQQLLIEALSAEGRATDATRAAQYSVEPAQLGVSADGLLRPLAEGTGEIVIRYGGAERRVPLSVSGLARPRPVSFQYEVIPILTKARCNSGGCHGKAEGQNGFKLSVFGFDTEADHHALTAESQGRRLSLVHPEQSLLLRKGSAEMPHGGGRKLDRDSDRFRRLTRWVAEGARFTAVGEGPVIAIEIEPKHRSLLAKEQQQLQVTAVGSDGGRQCVTREAEYETNSTIAAVDEHGLIQAGDVPGEAAILVRYLGHVAVCRVTSPRPGVVVQRPPEQNFIDGHVWTKLQQLGIQPSDPADDATFLRRVFLDTIGTLPTPDEARAFLADTAPDKRSKLIDALLERPEYVDYWTMRWADLLRVDQLTITPQGAVGMTRWIHKQVAANRPYDEFAREILTVQGSTVSESPAALYKAFDTPELISRSISQLFLGVRIECAQCHHHPSEKWSQDDYFAFAGLFTGVKRKPLSTGGEAVTSFGGTDLKHPRTATVSPAHALGAPAADLSKVSDRRAVLADWMTAPDNPFFARMIVNRLWAHYLGRGLIEPIDDIRDTNPPTNEPLLTALCGHLRDGKYDLKAFTKTLLNSRVYQLSPVTNETNAEDRQSFSHSLDKALPAEVMLDMVCQATGVPEKFNGWPAGYRSMQLWDSRVPTYFFRIFGRPVRASVCECERSNEPSIAQALHLLNSPEITEKLQHRHGTARSLAESTKTDAELVDELYLMTLSRFPREEERRLMLEAFSPSTPRRQSVEDILWTLLNAKEFLYNR